MSRLQTRGAYILLALMASAPVVAAQGIQDSITSLDACLPAAFFQGPGPTDISVTMMPTTATLTWPAVPGASGYIVCRGSKRVTTTDIAAPTFVDTGLAPRTDYDWRVLAVYPGFPGRLGVSDVVRATTLPHIGSPLEPDPCLPERFFSGRPPVLGSTTVSTTATTATLTWASVEGAAGYALCRGNTRIATAPLTTNSWRVTNLTPETSYDWRLLVLYPDILGRIGVGEVVQSSTKPPQNPRILTAMAGIGGDVLLEWEAATDAAFYWLQGSGLQTGGLQQVRALPACTQRMFPLRTKCKVAGLPPGVHRFSITAYYGDEHTGTVADELHPTEASVVIADPIRGFADLHLHQFGNLAMGGLAIWGQAYGPADQALPWCTAVHGLGGAHDNFGRFMRFDQVKHTVDGLAGALAGHRVGGYDEFDGWPRWDSMSHQTAYQDWLYRAHEGGLQLVVMLAVNNEWACTQINRAPGRTCDDMEAVDLQIAEAKNMEAYINANTPGGDGWYKIVYSARQAREAIAQGKLAVVLGVEVDNLFGCTSAVTCTPDSVTEQLERYYEIGVRHVFPIHFYDNGFGGAAVANILNDGSGRRVPVEIRRLLGFGDDAYAPETELCRPYGTSKTRVGVERYSYLDGRCNQYGLTALGAHLIDSLMKRRMIVDLDHMSDVATDHALSMAETYGYAAVVSGHSGFNEISWGDKNHEAQTNPEEISRINRLGGMLAPILHQGNREGIQWQGVEGSTWVPHRCGNSSETFAQAYLYAVNQRKGAPVAIGTDTNGGAGQIGPRFGWDASPLIGPILDDACPGGESEDYRVVAYTKVAGIDIPVARVVNPTGPKLEYPFLARGSGRVLGRSVVGQKTFDFNVDGFGHIGMLPDLFADLEKLGLSPQDLEPMFRSAEGYIRMWERAEANQRVPWANGMLVKEANSPAVYETREGAKYLIPSAQVFEGAGLRWENIVVVPDGTLDSLPTLGYQARELQGSTGAAPLDSDGDSLPDSWEVMFGLDPSEPEGDQGALADADHDGLTNIEELRAGSHPRGEYSRYLAEGATSSYFNTRLALMNPSENQARTLLRFLKADGTTTSYSLSVLPMSRATVDVRTVSGMADAAFSTVIESDEEVLVDRTMAWDASGYGSHAETSTGSAANRWYLSEGATHSGFDLFYLIQNPNEAAAKVSVRYLLPSGPPIQKDYTVPAKSRFNIWVNHQDPRLKNTDVAAAITSDLPTVVERAMYLGRKEIKAGKGEPKWVAGHASIGVKEPAAEWLLAEGATGGYFDLFVLVANPFDDPAPIRATFLLPSGESVIKQYTVAPNTRLTIWVDEVDRKLANTAVSTIITSTQGIPIVVERAMWWPGPTAATWAEAHNSAGLTSAGREWAIAEGEVGGRRNVETYILIANRGAAATARVTLYYEDGTQETKEFPLPAGSRTNVAVASQFPSSVARRFGAVVEAVGETAEIAVEWAMYSDSDDGQKWAAGANAVATKLR